MSGHITISRDWNNPKIHTVVSNESVSVSMDMSAFLVALKTDLNVYLEDFIKELKPKIGPVTFTFKQDTFYKQIDDAVSNIGKDYLGRRIENSVDNILKKVKQETVKVM